MKLCQGGIAADASSVQEQSTDHGSFLNEKGAFLNGGKLRKIIAVVASHAPHKEKCHPRQQEILLPQQCRKSRRVANPLMLVLDQVPFLLSNNIKNTSPHTFYF